MWYEDETYFSEMNFHKEGTPLEKIRIGQSALEIDFWEIEDIEFDGINFNDCPDFCDAYICYATYRGRELTQDEYDAVNDDGDFKYDKLMEYLH